MIVIEHIDKVRGNRAVRDLLAWAVGRLGGDRAEARADAHALLSSAAGIGRAMALAYPERSIDLRSADAFRAAVERRRCGEPVAYITGHRGFHAIEIGVDARVLVPRPESELLVDEVLSATATHEVFDALDLGTGSGALALAIATARPRARMTGVDVSSAALDVARANAQRLGICVRWVESDWLEHLGGERFDYIVCNPPYVRCDDPHMSALVREPRIALDGGADGLDAIRIVLRDAGTHLAANGKLLLEHGFDQVTDVAGVAATAGLAVERVVEDLSGHPRVTVMGLAQ